MELVGITPGQQWMKMTRGIWYQVILTLEQLMNQEAVTDLIIRLEMLFLRFIHIHGYDTVRHMTPEQMDKNVAKTVGLNLNYYQITAK